MTKGPNKPAADAGLAQRVVGRRHSGAAPAAAGEDQRAARPAPWNVRGWSAGGSAPGPQALFSRFRLFLAYALAVPGIALGTLLHIYVVPSPDIQFFYLFLGVAVVCVVVGGLGPGLFAVGLGAVASAAEMIWLDDAFGHLELINLGVYVAVGVLVCALVARLRAARRGLRISRASLDLLLERMPVLAWSTDRELVITSSEGGAMSALGIVPGQMVGVSLQDYLKLDSPQRAGIALKAHQRALEGKSSTYQMEWHGRLFHVHIEPLRNNERGEVEGTVAAALDVTESHRAEQEQALRHQVVRTFAEAPSLQEGAQHLLAVLGQALDWDLAVYWTVDRETRRLRCSALWQRAGAVAPAFVEETESPDYRAEACLPGRAWMKGEAIWVADVGADMTFRRAPAAQASGLRGGLWLPLPAGSAVGGVLEFLNCSGREPDAAVRGVLSDVCGQVAEFSRRWRAEETTSLLAAVLESTPDLVGISDLAGRTLHVNRAGWRMLGLDKDADLKRLRIGDFSPPWAAKIILEQGIPAAVEHGIWEGETAMLNRQTGQEVPVSQVIVCHKRPDGSPEFLSTIARDITERKNAESQLRLSHRVLQTTRALVLVADQELNIRYASPSLEQVLGYKPVEVMGRKFWSLELHAKEDRRELLRYLSEAGRGRIRVREAPYEMRMVHRDGSERWVLWQDSQGTGQFLIRVGQDVTEQRQMQQALAESERKFRAVAETAANAMYIHDGRRLVFVNQAALEISGYSREELMEQDVWLFIHPDFRDMVRQRAEARFRGEEAPTRYEYKIVTKSGETRWLDTSNAMVTFNGKPAVLATAFDVTDRKLAEVEQRRLQQAIERAAAEWRLTFDVIDSVIVIVDQSGAVKRLNRAAQMACGLEFDDTLGRTLASLGTGEPWKTAAGLAEESRSGFRRAKDREDGRVWDIHVTPFHTPTEQRRMVRAQDVTATVQLEQMLARSEKMAAMGALVGNVAHEVRNPLFGISATLDAFEARFGDAPEQTRYMKTLRSEFKRLDGLMHDLLEYGRPASVERAEGVLQDVMREMAERAQPLAQERQAELIVAAPPEPVVMQMDARRMAEMLQNLVANALQHAPPGSRVEVSLAVREGERGAEAVWTVRDHGPGFPAHEMERLFEPFYSRRKGGTGLGLPIVLRIAEEHGGKVELGNAPEGGAVATVGLPLAGHGETGDED